MLSEPIPDIPRLAIDLCLEAILTAMRFVRDDHDIVAITQRSAVICLFELLNRGKDHASGSNTQAFFQVGSTVRLNGLLPQ